MFANYHDMIHSFIHSFIKELRHLTTSNEKTEFAAQYENDLSCAVEAVGIVSGRK